MKKTKLKMPLAQATASIELKFEWKPNASEDLDSAALEQQAIDKVDGIFDGSNMEIDRISIDSTALIDVAEMNRYEIAYKDRKYLELDVRFAWECWATDEDHAVSQWSSACPGDLFVSIVLSENQEGFQVE